MTKTTLSFNIVSKLCGYAAAFRPDVWGCGPTSGRVSGVLGGVEMSLFISTHVSLFPSVL